MMKLRITPIVAEDLKKIIDFNEKNELLKNRVTHFYFNGNSF